MLESKVESFFRRKKFNLEQERILVGVSGGPDSLALLHFLWLNQQKWNTQVVAAHVDHMFRGNESHQEALFVQEFCEKRNIPLEVKKIDVPEYIEKTGLSPQVAARDCRYAFFEEVLKKHQLNYLALGHHGDDQIETILMRLTRGSTGKARAGIPFLRAFNDKGIVRPFLCLTKDEIEEYCIQHKLDPRRDPSNEKDYYSRNRFRKILLPFLKKENPKVSEHFQRFSEDIESDEHLLQELTTQKMNTVMKKKSHSEITISVEEFRAMPLPLQRRGIQLILNYLYKEKPTSLSAIHSEQIFSLVNSSQPSGMLDFPNGLKIVRSYLECTFQFYQLEVKKYYYELSGPGELHLPNGHVLTVEYVDGEGEYNSKNQFLLPFDKSRFPLIIRTRENGDRMTVKGMNGSKKVKSIFIDEKIPIIKRDEWPIIADCFGQILWVPGLKKGDTSSWHPSNLQQYILLKYKH